MSTTRIEYANALCDRLKLKQTLHRRRLFVGWFQAEGSNASFNPLGCIRKMPGSTPYNWVPVQNYVSLSQGVEATCLTLEEDQFSPILGMLIQDKQALLIAPLIYHSRWGTGAVITAAIQYVKDNWAAAQQKLVNEVPIPAP